MLARLAVTVIGVHRSLDCQTSQRSRIFGNQAFGTNILFPVTTVAISINHNARRQAGGIEFMVDGEAKQCWIFVGNEDAFLCKAISVFAVSLLIRRTIAHRGRACPNQKTRLELLSICQRFFFLNDQPLIAFNAHQYRLQI
ncbi:MAG: hypothetical protein AB7U35_12685 [Sphingobium sp.]